MYRDWQILLCQNRLKAWMDASIMQWARNYYALTSSGHPPKFEQIKLCLNKYKARGSWNKITKNLIA